MAVVIGLVGDATLNDGTTAILRMLMARAVHTWNPAMATAIIPGTTAAARVITMTAPASDLALGQAAGKQKAGYDFRKARRKSGLFSN
jgi:multisubunit Na+/H+ antiporter MnhG subunit